MQLHYEIRGDPQKPVILFIHGFLGSHKNWYSVIAPLTSEYSCLLVDLPGHGRSPIQEPIQQYSIPQVAAALAKLLEQLQISSCSVVGYSLGGRIALHLALFHQETVKHLILESCSPGLPTAPCHADKLSSAT